MTMPTHLHDNFFKRSLKDKRIALDFLRSHLPLELYARLDSRSLELTDKSFVLPELRMLHSDIIYRCSIDQQSAYVFFLIEHESTAKEKFMAFRKLQYSVSLMEDHLRQGHDKLPIVITMCLYHGKQSPYPYTTDIYDYFADPILAREMMFKPFRLIDLTVLSDEVIQQHGLAALMEMLFKHYTTRDLLQVSHQILRLCKQYRSMLDSDYLITVLEYIAYNSASQRHEVAEQLVQDWITILPDEREAVMTIVDIWKAKGLQQGLQQGLERGLQQGLEQGKYTLLLHLLQLKFHDIPEYYIHKMQQADEATLLTWAERLLGANNLAEIFDYEIETVTN